MFKFNLTHHLFYPFSYNTPRIYSGIVFQVIGNVNIKDTVIVWVYEFIYLFSGIYLTILSWVPGFKFIFYLFIFLLKIFFFF